MPDHDRVHDIVDTFNICAGTGLFNRIGVRNCLGQRKRRIGRFLKHCRDLLNVVLGAANLLGYQVNEGEGRTHVHKHRHANDTPDRQSLAASEGEVHGQTDTTRLWGERDDYN